MFNYVFIDFDKTIFDCFQFEQDMWKVAEERKISKKDYIETYRQAIHSRTKDVYDYTFEGHIQLLELRGYHNLDGMLDAWDTLLKNNYLFEGVEALLGFLQKNSKHLILLTAGNKSFQMKKISSAPIQIFFEEIVVLDGHKEIYLSGLNTHFGGSLFINDSMRENNILKQTFPDLTIVVRFESRDEHNYTEEQMKEFGALYFVSLKDMLEHFKQIT
ncbi:MAG: HAD hydrolase-like protein [Candidatus Magasanikbacteria bacterium]